MRPMGLLLNKPQCACKPLRFARIGIERGIQKEKSDHRKHQRACHEAKSPQCDDQSPLLGFKVQPTPELSPQSSNADPKTNRRDRRADRCDDPLPERLGEHPSRPVTRDLIATCALIPAQHRAQGHGGEAHVEEGGDP